MSNSSFKSISTAGTSEKTGLSHILSPSSNLQRGEEYQANTLQILEYHSNILTADVLQELTGGFDRLQAMHAELKKDTSLSALDNCKAWKRCARELHDKAKRFIVLCH
ncbi:hypothetical protein B0H21DRAFT_825431 [Amylocystis lapponica]|nr:hypothetical protein B0H21DRAFT_825431 [Amylocystis lapponica]